MMEMGLNDARHVVWALGEFFFFLKYVFFYTNILLYIYVFINKICDEEGRMIKTGLNDAKHIVWAICECFFFFLILCFFLKLTNILLYI